MPDSHPPRDWPLVYMDHMCAIAAGPVPAPTVGVCRRGQTEPLLTMTLAEARELAQALTWIVMECDVRVGRSSFYAEPRVRPGRKSTSQPSTEE